LSLIETNWNQFNGYNSALGGRRRPRSGKRRSANGVKTDNHDPATGGEPTQTEDNVVRLPREWLGPREDLVQIGLQDATSGAPPAPEDFWGEGSSDLQSALVGPPASAEVPDPGGGASTSGTPRRRDRLRSRPARTPAVIAAATAALILAVVVISALGGQRSGPPQPRVASISHRSGASPDGSLSTARVQTADARHLSLKPARARRPRSPARRRSHPAHPRPSKSGPTLVASSSGSVTYSSVSSNSPQTVSNTPAQAASAQPSQPAFGANGSLGPGRGAANTQ
jgi:hypothetical protein